MEVIRKKDVSNYPSYYKRVVHKANSEVVFGCMTVIRVGALDICTGKRDKGRDIIHVFEMNLRYTVKTQEMISHSTRYCKISYCEANNNMIT
ncbi:hypothetical protein NPIL_557811 [Nephila pilipes]|uniref:Uncharacterized protein n=1 Tax=Nephila pilipes TaxID=299642 RepID=A0A8X6PC67_NEPPI|nr:hypothetical protein NPIL_557811 [Nephila pilipes]